MPPLIDLLDRYAHTWWSAAIEPATWQGLWAVFRRTWLFEAAFYVSAALLVWGLLHRLLRRRLGHRLISGWPSGHDVRREVTYSVSTLAVFAAMGVGMVGLAMHGHIEVYANPAKHGQLWLWASLPVLILWHDTWFYWTHRLLHTRWLFRHVHRVHHRSRQPSPWAAYAFHPVEALIQGLVTPLALAVLPLHGGVLMLFQLHQILRNTHGHAAVETLPSGFTRHPLGRLFTTTTHHHLHHETGRGHYALWFTAWDRWCGTLRPDYTPRFEATCRPRRAAYRRALDARSSHERAHQRAIPHGVEQ